MVEIELNVMIRQCLARHIEDINLPQNQLSAWETERNHDKAKNPVAFSNRRCPRKAYIIISCIHNI